MMRYFSPFVICFSFALLPSLGKGQTLFAPPVQVMENTFTSSVFSPCFADFNNDGHLDIMASFIGYQPSFGILYNDGADQFPAISVHLPSNHLLNPIMNWHGVGDFDSDGFPEIFTAAVYLKRTAASNQYVAFPYPTELAMTYMGHGDFNNDGLLDLLLVNESPSPAESDIIYLGLNDGQGGLFLHDFEENYEHKFIGPRPIIKDITGDGRLDVIIYPQREIDFLTIYVQQDDSTFLRMPTTVTLAALMYNYQVADFDSDGDFDIVFSVGSIFAILENNDNTFDTFWQSPTTYSGGRFYDFDQDGILECLYAGSSVDNPVSVIFRNTDGAYDSTSPRLPLYIGRGFTYPVDFDGDGDLDVCEEHLKSSGNYSLFYHENLTITTSTAEAVPTAQYRFFPMPFTDQLQLQWDEPTPATIRVIDLFGRELHRQSVSGAGTHTLQLPNSLPAGAYTYILTDAGGRIRGNGQVVKGK